MYFNHLRDKKNVGASALNVIKCALLKYHCLVQNKNKDDMGKLYTPQIIHKPKDVPTKKEIQQMITMAKEMYKGERNPLMIQSLYSSGIRVGALSNLEP